MALFICLRDDGEQAQVRTQVSSSSDLSESEVSFVVYPN